MSSDSLCTNQNQETGGECAIYSQDCPSRCTNIHFVIMVFTEYVLSMQCGTPVRDALMAETNQPCIVVFRDCDDDEDTPPQFFISIEQQLMLESHNIITAIFSCIAAHYVFNLSYHKKTGDFWVFIQEKILQLPSKQGSKKNASTTSHYNGIQRYYSAANKL